MDITEAIQSAELYAAEEAALDDLPEADVPSDYLESRTRLAGRDGCTDEWRKPE